MKQILILLIFGVPASLALLVIGGDFKSSERAEPLQIVAKEEAPPPGPMDVGDLPIRQRILNWKYRHFDPQLGVFDWVASGVEAVPQGEHKQGEYKYNVVKPRILFSSFTTKPRPLKKTRTELSAAAGQIEFGKEYVSARLSGEVLINNTEIFTPRGLPETVNLRTDNLNLRAANRREGREVAAAEFWTSSVVHVTGPSFEVFGKGGMRGATELNRMTLEPPIVMHLIAREEGLFFGRKAKRQGSGRRIDVEGRGQLIIKRVPERNEFLMSLSGGVVVSDGDISVSSDKLGIKLGEGRTIEKATAIGNVVVRQGGQPRLFCEDVKWDVKTGRTVLTGGQGVRFTDGKNVLLSKAATLMEDRKTLLLGGGVEAQFHGSITGKKKPGQQKPFPRDWKVLCDRADVQLANEGGSLKARRVLLLPASGGKVLVTSADGAYEIKGGLVTWNAQAQVLEIRRDPELSRGKRERVRSDAVRVLLKEGTAVFTGKVVASFATNGASWKFQAGVMKAKFEARKGRGFEIKAVVLTKPGGRVRVDYTGRRGGEVQLHSDRVSWDAASQVAVLDSPKETSTQRLQHAGDWIEARKVTFEPQSKKAVFRNAVRAHLEEVGKKDGVVPGSDRKVAEAPFEMSCDTLTVQFDHEYDTRTALAEGTVKFTASAGGLVLACERARYVRGEGVTFEGKERPQLLSGKNTLSARRILVNLVLGRITFLENVKGQFDDGSGARMTAGCEKMEALYKTESGDLTEVYFDGSVHIEFEEYKAGKLTADAQRAVYEVEKAQVSLTGEPVMIRRGADKMPEKKVVYDLKEKILFTKPGRKGYDWEFDPSGWKRKRSEK
jgi:lipopolysaccharide export system protein LptA